MSSKKELKRIKDSLSEILLAMEDNCVTHTDAVGCKTDSSCRWVEKKGWFTSTGVCHSQVACSLNLTTPEGALTVDRLYNTLREKRDKSSRLSLKMGFHDMKRYAFLSQMKIRLHRAKKEVEESSAVIKQRNVEMAYYQKILDNHNSGVAYI